MKSLNIFLFKNAFLFILIIVATILFFLVLSSKSAYFSSDSYLYKHFYYQFKGYTYNEARDRILNEIDVTNFDTATKNILLNEETYKISLNLVNRRVFYPYFAYLTGFFIANDYVNLLIPVYLSYIGVIILIYLLIKTNKSSVFSFCVALLFLSFYPYVYWSTYFLTYTIGTFFWMFNVFSAYKYLQEKGNQWLILYTLSLVVSLTNRETSILLLPFLIFIKIFYLFKPNLKTHTAQLNKLLVSTILIVAGFFMFIFLFKQKNIMDAIVYNQNNFGLYNTNRSLIEVIQFWFNSVIYVHQGLLSDLLKHKLWGSILLLTLVDIFIVKIKKINQLEIILICSAIASYCALLTYPILSYRYFFPVVVSLVYFFAEYIIYFVKFIKRLLNLHILK
jgi:hypothetical protein